MNEHEHEHEHDHCDCGCEHEHEHEHDHDHCDCCCEHEHAHDHEQETVAELTHEPSFSYKVVGLDCPNCARNAQNSVAALSCVEEARLVYATATLDVVAAPNTRELDVKREVLATIRSCGQDLALSEEELAQLDAQRSWYEQNRESVLMFISGLSLVIGLITDHIFGNEARAIPFYVVAAVAGLIYVAPMAIASLKRKTADMNVLMGLAVLGALIMGFAGDSSVFGDAAIVIFLDQVGEWLEGWSMRKTSSSIKELAQLAPDVAHLIHDDHVHDVSVASVKEGQHIRILAGERVPLDGVIVRGSSAFNEAAITGESVPKDKGEGDEIYAGSLNSAGVVEVKVTADEDCTKLARIISMVQGAQAKKAPYESFIDRFAEVYTPIVVAVAAVIGICVPLVLSLVFGFTGSIWHDWVYRALSLLVVACPCALVISTPVSFVSAITRAAKLGILVKGGAYFDIASKVNIVAFDKTGTLTTGVPKLVSLHCFNGASERDLLSIAYALESNSTHPLARAICDYAQANNIKAPIASSVEEHTSLGVSGTIADQSCAIGKLSFVADYAELTQEHRTLIQEIGNTGATALAVAGAGELAGVLAIADVPRSEAKEALDDLKALEINELLMLTGDNAYVANNVASTLGITNTAAELLPEDKLAAIHELHHEGKVSAFVGDGINDAPALAMADLGITMGAAASDTALEVADVALLADKLSKLPEFFSLARRCMHVVQENIVFAILIKALVFVLVIAGVAGMGAAVFADTGVALLVILNGMRLMLNWETAW